MANTLHPPPTSPSRGLFEGVPTSTDFNAAVELVIPLTVAFIAARSYFHYLPHLRGNPWVNLNHPTHEFIVILLEEFVWMYLSMAIFFLLFARALLGDDKVNGIQQRSNGAVGWIIFAFSPAWGPFHAGGYEYQR
ncbi:hypothetical protein QBC39DRAFT_358317 [Podospora conica]|nr:hypothetical protein QBC39DRAFT_358317 [Schizothecium conicum]